MRLSKTSRWIVVIAMLPLAFVLFYLALPLALPDARTPPPYISFSFAGYTNDTGSNVLGQFVVSNVSTFDVRTPPGFAYNFMTNGRWPNEHVWITNAIPQQVLKPHGLLTVTVPIPTNGTPWRLRAGAERLPNGLERIGLALRRVLPSKLQFIPDKILSVRDRYTGWAVAYSGVIEPKGIAQPDGAGNSHRAGQ
jgi:hypothetical protein